MHQLFRQVLGKRDLSRAGDLFSLEDAEIEGSLSEALDNIKVIACSPDYVSNGNDQAVVEICITRITTAIRETSSIERHGTSLVGLWESCLEHNLTPQEGGTEDTPHAKIASDITSCILQNYSRPSVMALAIPVAVRFLQRGNRELSRNMSSYLSLAAIVEVDLLAEHTEAIMLSVLGGNHMLLRVLPSVYPRQPEAIHCHLHSLLAMMLQLESPEQQHLIRLIQAVAEKHPVLKTEDISGCVCDVPRLVSYLEYQCLSEALLGALVDVSQASPSSLFGLLPALRIVGQQFPALLGHVAKIHGSVGVISKAHAHSSLVYLVSLLGSVEHSIHHMLLLEIRALTDRYPSLLGGGTKDIYRMSNSFTAIARQLGRRLEDNTTSHCRIHEASSPSVSPAGGNRTEQQLQVSNKAFEDKMMEEAGQQGAPPTPERHYGLTQAVREERREIRFNRSTSLALHAVRSWSISSDTGEDNEGNQAASNSENKVINSETTTAPAPDTGVTEPERMDRDGKEEEEQPDKLFIHLRDNMETITEFCKSLMHQIPTPDHCTIEDSNSTGGRVARLSFSCPVKSPYCLYAKSCFYLSSRQPDLWIHIMLLQLQCKSSIPLCSKDDGVEKLSSLWEKIQLKGAHSFPMTMTQHATLHQKDLDSLQIELEEVRFLDLFAYSEEGGGWLCFMCSNPEKATGVKEGQPLMEGKLKEKHVRWKFIKRWKTRYFTLAGNQLLFRRAKAKNELEDVPIELSKVQSVKIVARKRRDRSLPRAFEIFTDSKTYVLKAQDEKHAEEWLQCINVAVAQARERENHEATTYL
ncbi:ventricular zone-expressed PH domain-containing protein isoform X1 [Takifugu rubripes]|uniref:ventricular zone-expressed PH domain-containing protein isoform X1 n=2 Tax=Takifugu rubripes TaxID=31033 RepID=UPI0005D15CD2|nr:ventricular zone-expressed PH domain-containing protein homolog 1 isoform X1 [Takifugu rubripes]XP_029699552.1 ventricular zone-expressed PH domain-containing protein homolog 1 isoform X1 [Takifugu rubripes]XP_029699553.1 ventricular zone-expressed PH domain-containing protein homolog 1 isoform X1 [Takifugu rubripes]XP_029699554.1 ventricular zone-expressed PH domain-containing protein homolog 1 isoform X1 [Takifugu rubripes]|eukprot:XP_011615504.1 PREDICTED: ventricular zone-expressed PH domain-containing protein homolog 1 isoform X3 [Takifugu rubripes]